MSAIGLALSPSGHLRIEASASDGFDVELGVAARIEHAFGRGSGHGMLHLGAAELHAALPPSIAWFRDFARRFVIALASLPDLEERRATVEIEPPEDLDRLASSAPPMLGAEYLTAGVLESLWGEIRAAMIFELAEWKGKVGEWLHDKNPIWNVVGRVVFHLAENKRDEHAPFAFLATYARRVSGQGKVAHVPLGRALDEFAGQGKKSGLVALLEPVQRASERSGLVKELVDSGQIFHPLAWTPKEAYAFLNDVPALEAAGVVVRIPDWWRRRARPMVSVSVGKGPPSGLGAEALLDFSVEITLDGERLTPAERAEIERSTAGLALIRGQWVEIDSGRLAEALAHWKAVEQAAKSDGLSFLEGMRLLAGGGLDEKQGQSKDDEAAWAWSDVSAGPWLRQVLEGLRSPEALAATTPGKELLATLRPYQEIGVRWLWSLRSLGLGGCLADDMGLGKTIQVLAVLLVAKRRRPGARALLVVPASLLANWKSEIERFVPSLRAIVAHPSAIRASELGKLPPERLGGVDIVITSYGSVVRYDWLREASYDTVVLDEAQAIKNPAAKQTRAVKALKSKWRLALTGTPVENRLSDLWSIFDFLCPGLLGSAKAFRGFAKRLESGGRADYAPLRTLVRPYILRRLKTDKRVIADLPDKTEVVAYCALTKVQAALYEQAVRDLAAGLRDAHGMKRRGLVLATLLRFKQICNHPAHWLRDGSWAEDSSGKLLRLRELAEPMASRQEKLLVFTQFREATGPLAEFLAGVFARKGLVLHGETSVSKRASLVEAFQSETGPPFFVLSLKAGGSGLNLTAASHVVHFDRWWNPAVENQATDRAYRIGQKKNVLVHKFVCRGTVEEKIDELIRSKQSVQDEVLSGGAEALLTELSTDEILRLVSLDLDAALSEAS